MSAAEVDPQPTSASPPRPSPAAAWIGVAVLASPFVTPFLFAFVEGHFSPRAALELCAASMLGYLALLPILLVFARHAVVPVYVLQSLIGAGLFFYVTLLGRLPGASSFYIVFETNFAEAGGFLGSYPWATRNLLLLLAGHLLAVPFLLRTLRRAEPRSLRRAFVLLALASLTPLVDWSRLDVLKRDNQIWRLAQAHRAYRVEYAKQQAMAARRPDELEEVWRVQPTEEREVHLLVLGESTSRSHMGLYGYARQTTPELAALGERLFVFRDVVSPHSHTIPSLTKLLTFANYEDETASFYEKGSLIQYLKKAGFRTYWLSNQVPMGINENLVTVLAKSSDVTLFLNDGEGYRDAPLDEALLDALARVLEGPHDKVFLVVHMMGTHAPYCERYPAGFSTYVAPFDEQAPERTAIDCYDNAVRYNDHLLARMIERLASEQAISSLLYVSDHGEDVYDSGDFMGHTEDRGTPFMFEVPMLLWLSDAYREARPEAAPRLARALDRKYMSDDMIHTLLGLLGVGTASYDPARDVASDAFAFRRRIVGGMDYDRSLAAVVPGSEHRRALFAGQSEEFRDRVWAHRVNSLGKLEEAAAIFRGIEVDVVFDGDAKAFDVNHPPAPSVGLSLERFLSALERPRDHDFWLDFKNLSPQNAAASLARLERLARRFELDRRRVIVESNQPELLAAFTDAGFYTSYYLPTRALQEIARPEGLQREDVSREHIERILARLAASRVDAVSAPSGYQAMLTRFIPERYDVLLWHTGLEFERYKDRIAIEAILSEEPRPRVLLTALASAHDR